MDTATGLKTLNLIITNPLLHFRCRNNYLFRPNYLAQQVKKKLLYISITSSPRFSPLCSLCMLPPPPLSLCVYNRVDLFLFAVNFLYIYVVLMFCYCAAERGGGNDNSLPDGVGDAVSQNKLLQVVLVSPQVS